jgi:hypothetical protein
MIPNARNQRKNEARLRRGNLARRSEAQISAARAGEVATKTPRATATALNKRLTAVVIALSRL